ncbi:MAG: hypothetical protein RIR91_1881 [Verrucomicrobiota bacterium]
MRMLCCLLAVAAAAAETPANPAAAPAQLLLAEGFEGAPVGGIPKGYTKDGPVRVVDDVFHSGHKSLRIDAAVKGPRRVTKTGPDVAAIGGEHWGRLYFRVDQPVPKVSSVHITFVSGKALSPQFNDPIETRLMGASFNGAGDVQYLYNVQTAKRGEFGVSTKPRFRFSAEWTLAEWHVDHATQTYQFFLNGEELKEVAVSKGAGKFERAEVPAAFQSLSFGFINYQPTQTPGFTVWIDDVALARTRLGPTAPPVVKAK